MQIIPLALGQTDGAITLWDENPELALVFPRPLQFISELAFGLGTLDEQPCLILYLFVAEQAIEVYLPESLPTNPEQEVDVWYTLLTWRPDMLKIRYGNSPLDQEHEVTLLFPKEEEETLAEKLTSFILRTKETLDGNQTQGAVIERLAHLLREVTM
ncbi:hypothetical protein [Sulfoacidibacillus thermotolerans]|uniref:Uncharacterized protein n=1 Tax=Sulfoacidibacillus thermotolerans TaxID=1765684 RepID=A0A2U3D6T3_SULT2|nr:hypothetical protein [Sulfoacidibacillus thermotolerans]PWI56988.1 hypothetical protein BM613_10940 [Sulfoacidibacillus thermotolerans]